MPRKTLQLEFPAAGVSRRLGLRAAAGGRGPYPSPWAVNTRLEDALTQRLRGGSFTAPAAGVKAAVVYRDRALTFSGNMIQASRQGDHSDFDFSKDVSDLMRATFWQLSEAGEVGETVVALVPCRDTYLAGFTADETWVQTGDPLTGGRRNVSRDVGILGPSAWCLNHDTLYFLSSHGLYAMGIDGGGLKAISEDRLPVELTGLSDAACVLDYNHGDGGVYIHLSSGLSWFYDVERDGFWSFDRSTTASHVLLGPFQLGTPANYGRVLNLHSTIAEGSADVTWRLVTGDTAEAAAANGKAAITASLAGTSFASYVASEGTWPTDSRNHICYPRTRAIWCCLWLAATGAWAYEEVLMTAVLSGSWR